MEARKEHCETQREERVWSVGVVWREGGGWRVEGGEWRGGEEGGYIAASPTGRPPALCTLFKFPCPRLDPLHIRFHTT